jgi:hypothetical protein
VLVSSSGVIDQAFGTNASKQKTSAVHQAKPWPLVRLQLLVVHYDIAVYDRPTRTGGVGDAG